MAEALADMERIAAKGGTLHMVPDLFARYRADYRARYLRYLHSRSGLVSAMIAGPSGFPAARMNKRGDIVARRLNELVEWSAAALRRAHRDLRPDLAPIRAGDADAEERLAAELTAAEAAHARMIAANKAIRATAKLPTEERVQALVLVGLTPAQAAKALQTDCLGRIIIPR